jgi:hypothetical protein
LPAVRDRAQLEHVYAQRRTLRESMQRQSNGNPRRRAETQEQLASVNQRLAELRARRRS